MFKRLWILFLRTGLILLLVGGLFATVLLNIHYHQLVRETEILRKDLQTITRANEALQILIARTHDLANLEQVARTRLTMISPSKVEFIFIDD